MHVLVKEKYGEKMPEGKDVIDKFHPEIWKNSISKQANYVGDVIWMPGKGAIALNRPPSAKDVAEALKGKDEEIEYLKKRLEQAEANQKKSAGRPAADAAEKTADVPPVNPPAA